MVRGSFVLQGTPSQPERGGPGIRLIREIVTGSPPQIRPEGEHLLGELRCPGDPTPTTGENDPRRQRRTRRSPRPR